MSAVIRTRRGRGRPLSTTALWLVLSFVLAFFLVQYGHELLLEHDLKNQAVTQRVTNASLADENLRLKAALEYYQSDKYVEQRAREDLNLRRSDEEVLIPVAGSSQSDGGQGTSPFQTPSETGTPEPTPTPQLANWEKWLQLFLPPGNSP